MSDGKTIPFGYCVVPEDVEFAASGARFQDEDAEEWDNWAAIIMRTRLFLVGTPVTPDTRGCIYLAYAWVQLPTEDGKPAQGLTPPFARAVCLN